MKPVLILRLFLFTNIYLVCSSQLVYAQEAPSEITKNPKGWYDIGISLGTGRFLIDRSFESVFRTLIPNELMESNINSNSLGFGQIYSLGVHGSYRPNSPTNQPQQLLFRFGLWAGASNAFQWSQVNFQAFTFDTLVSQNNGNVYPVDSVRREFRTYEYSYSFIQLDASLVARGKGEKRLTLYGGAGAMAGLNLAPTTSITQSKTSFIRIAGFQLPADSIFSNGERPQFETNQVRHSLGATMNIYVPLGVELRIFNPKTFLGRLLLFYEGRPMLSMILIPEHGVLADVGWMHQLGVRMRMKTNE